MDKKKVKEPNLIKKGFTLGKALFKYASEGFPNVSKEVYEERLLTCNGCEFLNRKKETCMVCGCVIEYKARMETESCPQKKW